MSKHTPESGRVPSLEEIELEVEAEGREWTRRRLQERLQQYADTHGAFFPSGRAAAGPARTAHPHPAGFERRGAVDPALRP